MSQLTFLNPDRLHDRPWRSAGHPFNRQLSAKRRWIMLLVFALLCALIGGYLFITDSRRVKLMAENELSKLIGGPVVVGRAKLSLFEGLRLEFVNVYVDDQEREDSLLFSAKQFLVSYDPRELLTGKLKLTQIVAIDPHVQLTENLDTGKWNYQRRHAVVSTSRSTKPGKLPALPEVILRNGQIDYAEVRNGEKHNLGSMNIEGQFAPSVNEQKYTFELQSRGGVVAGAPLSNPDGTPMSVAAVAARAATQPTAAIVSTAMGPTVTGSLDRKSGEVTAALHDFKFGKDIRSMLPAQVREWWDAHQLEGAVDIPIFAYVPPREVEEAKYRVETSFKGVALTVEPEEWMSRDEIQTQIWAARAFDSMRAAGLNSRGVIDRLASLMQPAPIKLEHVRGNFAFTEKGVILKEVVGTLEKNEFAIDGHIDGYSPTSPARIHIASTKTEIPLRPPYLNSMPRQVRELYEHLRPNGACSIQVLIDRPSFGGRLEVAGSINITDGNFVFDKFPYPVSHATGMIVFGYDPRNDYDTVKLVDLRGHGAAGGPNANSIIKLHGLIGPLNADAGVSVTVSSDNVNDEPLLHDSFPEEVRAALKNLDAEGRGEYPKFHGGFECRINRPIGPRTPWIIDTDVELRDAAGKMVAFPYFMEHVTGKLAIREGFVDIIGATMRKKDASLTIEGRVTWRAGVGGRPLEPGEIPGHVTPSRPDLKITARNVPIDKDLLAALPADRREWLEKAGLTGLLDIDGRVWRPAAGSDPNVARSEAGSELTHAFDIVLKNGTIWPTEGTFAVSNLLGHLRLLPDRLVINDMTGKRGAGDLSGRGEVSWPQNKPNIFFSGTATKLALDRTLYNILPSGAQTAWDAVKPEGVIDLDLSYRGAVGVDSRAATQPLALSQTDSRDPLPSSSSPVRNLDLIIHPVKLAATVQAIPYRLDDITGTVRLSNGKVQLTDLIGKHGDGTIRLSGTGAADKTDWDLRVSAERIKVDDTFRKALPGGLASVVDGLKLAGTIGFEFPKLTIRDADLSHLSTSQIRPSSTTTPSTPLDVDFDVKLAMNDASVDVGVPMTRIDGRMELEGTVCGSKLAALAGPLDLSTTEIAGRRADDVHAEFFKPDDQDALRIGKITGHLAGGDIWGHVDLAFPEVGDSRYRMSLTLRNADVRDLSGIADQNLSGEVSASFDLEGGWTDPKTRRGRGDVVVTGKEMYKIPLVLGLLQITNLSLPLTSPFTNAGARYNVDGNAVTFESIELRGNDMLMSGSGKLDFNSKKVNMTFTTDNPNWPKIPIVGEIAQAAKHELLQIHVKGTLEDPKVSATAVNTVTTTVDEVFQGKDKK